MTETNLPEGRLTNKEVAQYVALQLADARDEIRDEAQEQQKTLRSWIAAYVDSRLDGLRDREKRFRIEMRAWLAGAVMLNALHPAGVAASILGALGSVASVHALARLFNR